MSTETLCFTWNIVDFRHFGKILTENGTYPAVSRETMPFCALRLPLHNRLYLAPFLLCFTWNIGFSPFSHSKEVHFSLFLGVFHVKQWNPDVFSLEYALFGLFLGCFTWNIEKTMRNIVPSEPNVLRNRVFHVKHRGALCVCCGFLPLEVRGERSNPVKTDDN